MKLAVFFPGIGYTCDRPLLYYAGKLTQKRGYESFRIAYPPFESKKAIRENRERMEEAFRSAYQAVCDQMKDCRLREYDDILFVSKSIGTICACAYAKELAMDAPKIRQVLYTPVEDTFRFAFNRCGIAFHGTKDPWAEDEPIIRGCERFHIPLFLTEGGNHSLETGDVKQDLRNMEKIMTETARFLDS